MLWMPSRPSTTLPPYFLMGFSACNAVGARFTGAGAKDVVLCSSAYTARSRTISRQRHARIELAMFRSAIDAQKHVFVGTGSRSKAGWMLPSVLLAASSVFGLWPQQRRLLGYSSVGRARSRPWTIGGDDIRAGPTRDCQLQKQANRQMGYVGDY